MAATSPLHAEPVYVIDGTLYISDLAERDPAVVRFVCEADDPVEGTQLCLRVGALALTAVNATVDTHIVEKRFDAMSTQFDDCMEQTIGRIAETADALLDGKDGSLHVALAAHHEQIENLLGSTFDPDSKRSVVAILETVLAEAAERQVAAVRKLVATDADGPLALFQRNVERAIADGNAGVRKDFQELAEKVAVREAIAPVIELTTGKGFTFEDVLHGAIGRIAALHGDLADRTGKETGSAATQKGDEVVTLDLDDTHGFEGRFVLEAKNRKLNMRKTHEELDDALENRDALAAIAVFTTQEQAPTSVPFHQSGNKAIVVFDADGSDDAALRLAYMWARWIVRRELSGAGADDVDLGRVSALIEDARRAIDRASAIKRCHTTAKKSIDQAAEQVAALTCEVQEALDAVAEELAEDLGADTPSE